MSKKKFTTKELEIIKETWREVGSPSCLSKCNITVKGKKAYCTGCGWGRNR